MVSGVGVTTFGVKVENIWLHRDTYKYVQSVKVMNADCWLHIIEFCDIKERGRIFSTQKLYARPWSDLSFHYLGHKDPALLQQLVYRDWTFLKDYCIVHNNTLAFPNGTQTSCWSPWCSGEQFIIKREAVTVQFQPHFNVEHARFIQWVRRLAQTQFGFRMLEPRHLLARYRWKQYWRVCSKEGIIPIMLPIANFRVRVFMHGLPCPRVERGMLVLRIVEFEFKHTIKANT